ncbi:MAG: lipopolysaccharide export system chaperone component LptA [Saliniramus fredricksonii]|uniref:Lipopolysaccharide export system chaperone component LptA n=1 Tax=Saliniramus fredricksonii TaxID=1653334 RepID=A0A0P7X4H7_9HYPH|nr:LptA/OstA family protein [Saliniramus fredricksonii]KPQ09749.1 MAG: lipopolysaccharide export system chaperone component LptA [Saliniramus fredricksonii]SCC80699.1 lipopolysaccharide export system protein LptA [Saliniramus fredricksonii]
MRWNALARVLLLGFGIVVALLMTVSAQAQNPDRAFGGLGSESDAPIRIDADRLDVFDRENRAVYAGNVVAVQGDTTIRCAELTIHFERNPTGGGGDDAGDAIRRIECAGPVTILSEDQVATGDQAVYDRASGQMVISGNVALSQGRNVTRGERLVYDIDRGVANVESGGTQRVRGLFVPGGADE